METRTKKWIIMTAVGKMLTMLSNLTQLSQSCGRMKSIELFETLSSCHGGAVNYSGTDVLM